MRECVGIIAFPRRSCVLNKLPFFPLSLSPPPSIYKRYQELSVFRFSLPYPTLNLFLSLFSFSLLQNHQQDIDLFLIHLSFLLFKRDFNY